MAEKTEAEHRENIENYIAAREWYHRRVHDGTATDEDARKMDRLRELAVEARAAGVTAPAFE